MPLLRSESSMGALRTAAFIAATVASVACVIAVVMSGRAAAEDGEAAYNNACRTCHSVKADDNRLGPNLHNIVGRKAGAASGFPYSDSLKNSGVTWDEATLDKFIAAPDSVVPNNNMKPFTGISDAKLRATIVSYLKTGATGAAN